jgi:hypothetical protein
MDDTAGEIPATNCQIMMAPCFYLKWGIENIKRLFYGREMADAGSITGTFYHFFLRST